MRALQLRKFGSVSNLRLIELPDPKADSATAIVKIAAGAISPSDATNVEAKMEHPTLPCVPGRDYAGTAIHGPVEWIGAEESWLFGADTRQRDATASAALLDALTPFFDQGAFQAPMIDRVIPLADGRTAYEKVARGEARGRLVLVP
jgi:NADPH:quinone reductase-like Zn-dependent oxidoreductase